MWDFAEDNQLFPLIPHKEEVTTEVIKSQQKEPNLGFSH